MGRRQRPNAIAFRAPSVVSVMIQSSRIAAAAPHRVNFIPDLLELRAAELGARRRTLQRGQSVDIPDGECCVLIVIKGMLSVVTPTVDGKEAFLSDVRPGEMVGEAFALGNDSVPLAVTAVEQTEVWALRRTAYLRALSSVPEFTVAAMDAMCRRQCRTNLRMAESVTMHVADRLAAELLRLAQSSADGDHIDDLPTHRELAVRIASHREAVTKELSRLERVGAIRRKGHRLALVGPSWSKDAL
ncbi:Crp/Fnr family transcriptional regulator [Hansschlegelia sp. KR7-227]